MLERPMSSEERVVDVEGPVADATDLTAYGRCFKGETHFMDKCRQVFFTFIDAMNF